MSWKPALYNYVHAKNQAELRCSAESLTAFVADSAYIGMQEARLGRLSRSYQDRNAVPLRSETKLRLTRVKETAHGVIADIELRRQLLYRIGSARHTEQRIEAERVLLDPIAGKWLVRSAEMLGHEKSMPAGQPGTFFSDQVEEPVLTNRSPSLPYLNHSILNSGETLPRKIRYNREKAVEYAQTWWSTANPKYLEYEVDCTNYVSQCLFAGGAPMDYTGKRGAGWWYSGKKGSQELWSYSWAVAHSLQSFVPNSRRGLQGVAVTDPTELRPGDMISYDWDGNGRCQHNTFVTSMDANGMPLVNAHTYNSRDRYWDYRDSPAWNERTRYVFVRIADDM